MRAIRFGVLVFLCSLGCGGSANESAPSNPSTKEKATAANANEGPNCETKLPDWAAKYFYNESYRSTRVTLEGRKVLVCQYQATTSSDYVNIDGVRVYTPMGFKLGEVRDEATGAIILAVGKQRVVPVPGYGVLVQSPADFDKLTDLKQRERLSKLRNTGEWDTGPMSRVDAQGNIVPTDVLEAEKVLDGMVLLHRQPSTKTYVLETVNRTGVTGTFPGYVPRVDEYLERGMHYAVLATRDAEGREVDYLLDHELNPIASPPGGLFFVQGERTSAQGGIDSTSLILTPALGSLPEDDLFYALDANGYFDKPKGSRGVRMIPDGIGPPALSLRTGAHRNQVTSRFYVRYDVDGPNVKKWGLADGHLQNVTPPLWYDVIGVQRHIYVKHWRNAWDNDLVVVQDEQGFRAYAEERFVATLTKLAGSGATAHEAIEKGLIAAAKNGSDEVIALDTAWRNAVQTKNTSELERLVWIINKPEAWWLYVQNASNLTPEQLRRASIMVGPEHTAAVEKLEIQARNKREREWRAEERAQLEREAKRMEEAKRKYAEDHPYVPSATTYSVAPTSQSSTSSTSVGANAGASQTQVMQNYGRWLDQQIYRK